MMTVAITRFFGAFGQGPYFSTAGIVGILLMLDQASPVAQLAKNQPAMWETLVDPWVGKIPWRRERLSTPVFWPGEFHGLYIPWTHRVAKSQTRLSDFHFTSLMLDLFNQMKN